MLIRCVQVEFIKLRHTRIWLILFILPLISVIIGCFNFYMNQGVMKKEWYSLWSQVSLFYGEFFFPILISILCAFLWRLEHFNKNWNMIMSVPISATSIFFSKLIVVGSMMTISQGLFVLLYLFSGKLLGLTSELPVELFGWLLRGWIAALTISTLQLALSMRIKSFAVPIGIGFCAAILGLGMYVINLGLLFPHSLLTIGMGILNQSSISSLWNNLLFYIMNGVYIFVFSLVAIYRMKKSDVVP